MQHRSLKNFGTEHVRTFYSKNSRAQESKSLTRPHVHHTSESYDVNSKFSQLHLTSYKTGDQNHGIKPVTCTGKGQDQKIVESYAKSR